MIQDDRLPLKQKFLEYFAEVPIQKYGAAYIGKDEDTVCRWKSEDADFADQIERTKAEYIRQTLKEVRSKEWILERLFKDHFAESKKTEDINASLVNQIQSISKVDEKGNQVSYHVSKDGKVTELHHASWFKPPKDQIINSENKNNGQPVDESTKGR